MTSVTSTLGFLEHSDFNLKDTKKRKANSSP